MPLINCKIHLELNWSKDCVMLTIADTKFEITNSNLYAPIVTLWSRDNVKLVKLLEEGFKRPVLLEWVPNKNRNKRFRQ